MSVDKPNHVRLHSGETSFGESFGSVKHVTPIHFAGPGHSPHLEVRFMGGLRLDLTPQTFVELLREGQAALAKLPHWPDCADSVGGVE